jgi:hypothetical protein
VIFGFLNAAVFSLIFCAAFIFIQILKFKKAKQVGAKEHHNEIGDNNGTLTVDEGILKEYGENQKGDESIRAEHGKRQKENDKINQEDIKGAQKEKTGKLFLVFQAIFAFLIFINFCVVAFFTFLFPIRFWDAISCWSLKGRAFFIDGSVTAFYTQHQYGFTHLTYPLYISLSQTWIYIWLGEINETLVKAIFPLFYLSLIFIVYYLLRKEVIRLYAIISVFILSTLPVIMDHGYFEYTNLIFSVILLLGVYFFYVYILDSSESHRNDNRQNQNTGNKFLNNLVISAIFFTILISIRSEGILFLIIFLIINTVYNLSVLAGRVSYNRRNKVLAAAVSILLPAATVLLLMAPWTILQAKLNISGASTEWVPVIAGLKNGLKDIFNGSLASGAFLGEFLFSKFDSARAFLGSSYGISWIVLAVMAIFNIKKLFKSFNWIFFVFLSAGFIALFISLGFIPEFAWSTERYMLHLFPLAYFWIMRPYLSSTISLKSFAPEK